MEKYIYAILYIVILNLIGFLSMGMDKQKAKKGKWRIKEKTLFGIAMFGGSIGSIVGMQIFRHKTKHNSFKFGMPVILFLQVVIITIILMVGKHI